MRYETSVDTTAPSNWDDFVKNTPDGTLYQTTVWARYLQKYYSARPIFLSVKNNDELVGGLLVFIESKYQNFLSKNFFSQLTTQISGRFAHHLQWVHGPLLLKKSAKTSINYALALAIKKYRIKTISGISCFRHDIITNSLIRSEPWSTFLIDLQNSDNKLFLSLEKKLRKNITRTEKKGVIVKKVTSCSDLIRYCKFYVHNKGRIPSINFRKYFKNMVDAWDILRQKSYLEIFFAEYNGRIISGISVWGYNFIAHEAAISRSNYEKKHKIYTQDLLKWRAILHAKSNGFRWFDLSGATLFPKNSKDAGILKYKQKWGGQQVKYYRYTQS